MVAVALAFVYSRLQQWVTGVGSRAILLLPSTESSWHSSWHILCVQKRRRDRTGGRISLE
jgi:hypothetical protein